MPAMKSASTKQFNLSYNEWDGTIQVSTTTGSSVIVHKSEAKALARILASMTDTDD